MTLDSREFLDPALVAEFNEQQPCHDCIHRLWMWGLRHRVCTLHSGRVGYQVCRCEDYHHGKEAHETR